MIKCTLPAGIIIKIGENNPDSTRAARGLIFRVKDEVVINTDNKSINSKTKKLCYCAGLVLENPNGWHSDKIAHTIDLNYDSIVGGAPNKFHKNILDKYDG